jgi:hypothetical protein
MLPNLLEIAISITPRQRAWMFSSVTSSARPRTRDGQRLQAARLENRLDGHFTS